MAQRDLPTGPDEIFRLAEPVLTTFFGKGAYFLGGGTALASIWQHRHSTDIDFFMDAAAFRAVVLDDVRRESLSRELTRAVKPEILEVRRGGLVKLFRGDGELGLYIPPSPIADMPPVDWVRGTSVPLERVSTILARKLHGRMTERQSDLLPRDLYDLAAAAELAPDDLKVALRSLTEEDRSSLLDNLTDMPTDFMAPPRRGERLIGAKLPASLAENPDKCVDIVRDMMASGRGQNPAILLTQSGLPPAEFESAS